MKEYRVLTTYNPYGESPLKKYEKFCEENKIPYEFADIYDSWDYITLCWRFEKKEHQSIFEKFVRQDIDIETYIP